MVKIGVGVFTYRAGAFHRGRFPQQPQADKPGCPQTFSKAKVAP